VITGEFLTADDLGPLGRLVEPGGFLVLEKGDLRLVTEERKWIGEQYRQADRKAEGLRKRLSRACLAGKGQIVRDSFDAWAIEAAKLALCDLWLGKVAEKIGEGSEQVANPPGDFRWMDLPQIQEVVQRVINARDPEIIGGAIFRAR
jgi:hypothetical protein